MNKSDLIHDLSEKEDLTDKKAGQIINFIFDVFTEVLKKGRRIEIRRFGSFSVREYKSYTGINPKTGKTVEVKSKRSPFFKVGRELKKKVNG